MATAVYRINPHKLHLIPSILARASQYYSDEILELPSPLVDSESLDEDVKMIDRDTPPMS